MNRKSMPLEIFYEMVAEGLLNDAVQDRPGVLLQVDLLKEIIFCIEFWHKAKGCLSEPAKYVQTVAVTRQEKLRRSLRQCTAQSVMWVSV
jgi:hypothetical protein